jgi:hypothetical protein
LRSIPAHGPNSGCCQKWSWSCHGSPSRFPFGLGFSVRETAKLQSTDHWAAMRACQRQAAIRDAARDDGAHGVRLGAGCRGSVDTRRRGDGATIVGLDKRNFARNQRFQLAIGACPVCPGGERGAGATPQSMSGATFEHWRGGLRLRTTWRPCASSTHERSSPDSRLL